MTVTALGRLLGLAEPGDPAGRETAGYSNSETVVVLVAALASVGGLIHLGAAVDHFSEFPLYTVVFAVLAAVQLAWATVIATRPSRPVLLLGCVINAGVIALWGLSRTIGVPVGPRVWVPEAIGLADLLETASELAVVIAVWSVLASQHSECARRVMERIAPVLIGVLLVSVLYGVGAHAG